MNASDRMKEIVIRKRSLQLLACAAFSDLTATSREEKEESEQLQLLSILSVTQLHAMRRPRLIPTEPIARATISVDTFSDEYTNVLYGFSKEEISRLYHAMQIPEYFVIGDGKKAFNVDGMHAFLFTLYRYHSPSERLTLDSALFHYDYSTLSKIFTTVVSFLHTRHAHRLRRIPDVVPRLGHFNERIRSKINSSFNVIPDDAQRCALFADACRIEISRPSGEYWRQRAYYSGHKHYHNLAAQGVFGPDGMFVDWFDGPVGRLGDINVMRESNVNAILRDSQLNRPIQYWIYTDKGYVRTSHVRCAAHGPAHVSAIQHRDNGIMSRERIGVEWGFGKVYARCKYIRHASLLKVQDNDVSMRVAVAVTNAHTCIAQSQT
eukprot:gene18564-21128_t